MDERTAVHTQLQPLKALDGGVGHARQKLSAYWTVDTYMRPGWNSCRFDPRYLNMSAHVAAETQQHGADRWFDKTTWSRSIGSSLLTVAMSQARSTMVSFFTVVLVVQASMVSSLTWWQLPF